MCNECIVWMYNLKILVTLWSDIAIACWQWGSLAQQFTSLWKCMIEQVKHLSPFISQCYKVIGLTHSLAWFTCLSMKYFEILQAEKALGTISIRSSTMHTRHVWLLITQGAVLNVFRKLYFFGNLHNKLSNF